MTEGASAIAATAERGLLALPVLIPAAGVLLSFLLGGRRPERIALGLMPVQFAVAIAIAVQVWRSGEPIVYVLGGYAPPLGIALRADGFSAVMLVTASLIMPAAGIYARANFATPNDVTESRAPLVFWTLLQAIQAALSLIFLGGDLFNLYVALELLTFAAVPMVCLDGRPETLAAALRYLMFALFGALFLICLGRHCFMGLMATPSTSSSLSRHQVRSEPAIWLATGLMTAGLLAEDPPCFRSTLWLPPAHARQRAHGPRAPCFPDWWSRDRSFLSCGCGSMYCRRSPTRFQAPFWRRSVPRRSSAAACLALRRSSVAETVDRLFDGGAQIGLSLPDVSPCLGALGCGRVWRIGVMQALSLRLRQGGRCSSPAGLVAGSLGHDQIAGLGGAARAMPVTFLALGLGGLSLMGLPAERGLRLP